jgi:hypothetical protein
VVGGGQIAIFPIVTLTPKDTSSLRCSLAHLAASPCHLEYFYDWFMCQGVHFVKVNGA